MKMHQRHVLFRMCFADRKQTVYLFELPEEVSLECRLLGLLRPAQPRELVAAVRFDGRLGENSFVDAAENDVERPGQDTGIGVGA